MTEWWVRERGSEVVGPVSTDLIVRGIEAGRVSSAAQVCRAGTAQWLNIGRVAEFAGLTYDDEAATRVTDSPWFMQGPHTLRPEPQLAPPPRGLGLAPPPPPRRELAAGRHAYDEADDDMATRVALPPSEGSGSFEYVVDDETMTRVAGVSAGPSPPAEQRGSGGVLPTLPMNAVPEARREPQGPKPAKPRPAAGTPVAFPARPLPPRTEATVVTGTEIEIAPHLQVRPDELVSYVPAGHFPPAPGAAPPAVAHYSAPPVQQDPLQPGMAPQGPTAPTWRPPPPQGDHGLRALVALIVFLAVALAVVMILLVVRR